jgi:hypothetical protein
MTEPTTDFRALCAELVGAWIKGDDIAGPMVRARYELAQPEPQEAMIPDQYKGYQVHVYRAGFHAGYTHGLTRPNAALAQPEPVPVSERLPGPEDCDKEGCCWWWDYGQDSWSQGMPEYCINRHTHWLPHWALPMPGVEGADA